MHGGSDFGDRHTAYHEFRLRVLDDFPGNKVIVFPHHVTYLDNDYLHRTAALVGRHPDVTLFARSLMTQHLLARHFGPNARVELAPDLAFMLGPQARSSEPLYDVVWIARTDSARAGDQTEVAARLSSQAAEKFLLPKFADGIEVNFVVKQRPPTVLLTDWFSLFFENEQARTTIRKLAFDAQSEVYIARAIHILSLGHIVITDRLRRAHHLPIDRHSAHPAERRVGQELALPRNLDARCRPVPAGAHAGRSVELRAQCSAEGEGAAGER